MIKQEFLDFLDEQLVVLSTLRRVETESGSGPLSSETSEMALGMIERVGQGLVKFARSDPPTSPFEE